MLEAESAVACCRDHNSLQIDGVGFVHHDQSMLWQDVGTPGGVSKGHNQKSTSIMT
jgi:hypothetical protein